MSWQILLGINLAAASVREFLNKKVADKLSPFVGLFYITLFAQIFFYITFFVTSRSFPRIDFFVSLTGIMIVAAFVCYFAALKISLSQSILFQSYSILVTVLLSALFLGESKYFDIRTATGVKVVFGIVLAFLALWYLLHQNKKSEEKLERKWFIYILGTILFGGIGSFLSVSYIHKYTPLEVLINQENLMTPLLLSLALFNREKVIISKSILRTTFINAFFSTIAVVAFYQALLLAPVATFYPLQQLILVIITMFTSVIFYKETDLFSGKKLIGMILGLAGMVLLITA